MMVEMHQLSSIYPECLSTFPLGTLCLVLPELIDSLYINLSQTWVPAINEGRICRPDSEVRAHGRVICSLRRSPEADAGVVQQPLRFEKALSSEWIHFHTKITSINWSRTYFLHVEL